jgi:hypothetical protein
MAAETLRFLLYTSGNLIQMYRPLHKRNMIFGFDSVVEKFRRVLGWPEVI